MQRFRGLQGLSQQGCDHSRLVVAKCHLFARETVGPPCEPLGRPFPMLPSHQCTSRRHRNWHSMLVPAQHPRFSIVVLYSSFLLIGKTIRAPTPLT